ncbi:MAG: sugar ABC transporter permease [Chloroflexi bacterium]|nr:sugar ABC transporter permease [Chloroflexota bacterium]
MSKAGRITAFFVLLPSIVLLAIFVYGLIWGTLTTSLTDLERVAALRGLPGQFIGAENYERLVNSGLERRFRIDMVNTVFFTLSFIAACLASGLGLAVLIDQKIQFEGVFRTIFLFPMALSFVVTGVVWRWLFQQNSGLNVLPTAIGLPAGNFSWHLSQDKLFTFNWADVPNILVMVVCGLVIYFALNAYMKKKSQRAAFLAAVAFLLLMLVTFNVPNQAAPLRSEEHGFNVALFSITIAAAWQMSGYTMAMYLAGLRGISDDLREAARVDGATELGVYRHIVLPLLQPITLSAMIILGHISLKIFDLVYTIGGENPLQIDMPGLYMYFVTFRSGDYGRGAAIATIMLIMVAIVIVPYLATSLRKERN